MREFAPATLLVLFVAGLAGCDKTDQGTVDSVSNPPFVSAVVITPDTINIDSLASTGGLYTISVDVNARVSDPDGAQDVQSVTIAAKRPSAESPFVETAMHDDGIPPDKTSGDGIFSGRAQFTLTRSTAGLYRMQVIAVDNAGMQGNIVEKSLYLRRNNSPPRLLSVSAPDTVTLPVGGSTIVHITVAAADSDGLADIQQVYFRSLTSTTPDFKFLLKDDGGADPAGPPLFQPSGDSVAGDGTFSILIPLRDSPTVRRTNIFAFQAIDSFGDTSATRFHNLTVR